MKRPPSPAPRILAIGFIFLLSRIADADSRPSPGGFRTSLRPASTTLAHDGAGLELRDVSASAGASGSRQCFDTSGGTDVALGTPRRHPPSFPWLEQAVFAPRPGGFVAFGVVTRGADGGGTPIPDRMDVADFDCLTGFTNIRTVVVPTVRRTGGRSPGCLTPDGTSVVMPDLHLFSKGDGGYCHWNPTTSTFTIELQPSALDPLLTPLALDALHETFGDTLPTTSWTANAIIGVPDGSLWSYVLLSHPGVPRAARHDFRFIVRRAPDGTLSTIGGLSDGGRRVEPEVSPWLHHDPTSGRVLGIGYANDVAVWNPATPSAPAQFATAAGLDFTPRGNTDHVPLGPGPRRFRLVLDDTAFDGDLDGLPLGEELAHETSDRDTDSDDDGALDGYEVHGLHTDPTDPLQPALTAAQRATTSLAPSTLIDDWGFLVREMPFGPERTSSGARFGDGVLCSTSIVNGDACFEADGTQRAPFPLPPGVAGGEFADDGACVYAMQGDSALVRRDAVSGVEVTIYTGDTNGFWPVSCRTVFLRRLDNVIVRISDGVSFEVADPARECPLAGSEAELNDCAARHLSKPANFSGNFVVLGVDPALEALLLTVDTYEGQALAAIDGARALRLLRADTLDRSKPIVDVAIEPAGRRLVLLGEAVVNAPDDALKVVPVTGAWAPIEGVFPSIPTWVPSTHKRLRRFGNHLVSGRYKPTLVVLDPPAGADGCSPCCACGPGGVVCQPCAPSDPPKVVTWEIGGLAEWLTLEPGLQPGETVFAGPLAGLLTTVVDTASRWSLFRSAANGGIQKFFDRPLAAQLADAPLRRTLLDAPLGQVVALGAAPGARALCFVDDGPAEGPEDGRVWRLGLDTTGRPATLTLEKSGAYTGCSFDDAGTLVALRSNGQLDVGTNTLGTAREGLSGVLVRQGDRWLAGEGDRVRCLDDAGLDVGLSRTVTGFAPGPHGLVFFTVNDGDQSWGGAATLADFCLGQSPTDSWFDPAKNIYDVADEEYRFSNYPVRTDQAALAVRPDGVVLAAFGGLRIGLLGVAGPPAPLWRIRPAWIPADGSGRVRLTALDPDRRQKPRVGIHQTEGGVTALVTVPGGDAATFKAADTWEFRGMGTPEPPRFPIEPEGTLDGGTSDGGDGTPEPPPGCGCGGGPFAAIEGLFALGMLARRRRTATTCSIRESA